jgi:hypothetical protein
MNERAANMLLNSAFKHTSTVLWLEGDGGIKLTDRVLGSVCLGIYGKRSYVHGYKYSTMRKPQVEYTRSRSAIVNNCRTLSDHQRHHIPGILNSNRDFFKYSGG